MNKVSSVRPEMASMNPKEFRMLCRNGVWSGYAVGACIGYVQANLAIIPEKLAFEFLLFCNRNPKPCPILDVTEPGSPHPLFLAPEADLRTDLPRYCVYVNGKLEAEVTDITSYWRDDLVAFLLGCRASVMGAMKTANLSIRTTGAYISNISCVPAGRFNGPMVVSLDLVHRSQVVRAVQITARYPFAHGAPVHIGDPKVIGIDDINKPDFFGQGEIFIPEPDEIPVCWACGITPQAVAMEVKPPLMITHYGGCMFVSDRLCDELAVV
jgi:uncharacterized protein YcsI (UPF0317 family)